MQKGDVLERCIFLVQHDKKVFVKLVIMNIFQNFPTRLDN